MSTEYGLHAIAVGNVLFGPYNFLVLPTPPGWRVVVMPMASDVMRHVTVGEAKWVRDGEVEHFLYTGSDVYSLKIRARPGRKEADGGAPARFGPHPAAYRVRQVGRLRRGEALEVSFYCDVTDRTVTIEVKGRRAPLELLSHLQHGICH